MPAGARNPQAPRSSASCSATARVHRDGSGHHRCALTWTNARTVRPRPGCPRAAAVACAVHVEPVAWSADVSFVVTPPSPGRVTVSA